MIALGKDKFICFVVIGMVAGLSATAEAAVESPSGTDVETFSANYGWCTSPQTGDENWNLNLSDFNPALGTLTGVTLTLISYDTIESEVVNLTGQSQTYSGATASLPVTLTALGGQTATTTGVAGPFSGTVAGPQFTTAIAGTSQVVVSTSTLVAPGDLVLYEGAGNTFGVNVLVSGGSYSGSAPGGTVAFAGNGTSCGTVEVTYDYVPVPEPGTLIAGLGLLGYCGIGVVRRVRSQA